MASRSIEDSEAPASDPSAPASRADLERGAAPVQVLRLAPAPDGSGRPRASGSSASLDDRALMRRKHGEAAGAAGATPHASALSRPPQRFRTNSSAIPGAVVVINTAGDVEPVTNPMSQRGTGGGASERHQPPGAAPESRRVLVTPRVAPAAVSAGGGSRGLISVGMGALEVPSLHEWEAANPMLLLPAGGGQAHCVSRVTVPLPPSADASAAGAATSHPSSSAESGDVDSTGEAAAAAALPVGAAASSAAGGADRGALERRPELMAWKQNPMRRRSDAVEPARAGKS